MPQPPSLISLGLDALKRDTLSEGAVLPIIYELQSHLFDMLVARLPPLALHKLQAVMPFKESDDYEDGEDCLKNGRKRGRNGGFNAAWKALFKLRWPNLVDCIDRVDWEQMYWETHLQDCLDEATAIAMDIQFDGCISEINVSGCKQKYIGCDGCVEHLNYSKLYYHCHQFGNYLRCLRLHNVLLCCRSLSIIEEQQIAKVGSAVDPI